MIDLFVVAWVGVAWVVWKSSLVEDGSLCAGRVRVSCGSENLSRASQPQSKRLAQLLVQNYVVQQLRGASVGRPEPAGHSFIGIYPACESGSKKDTRINTLLNDCAGPALDLDLRSSTRSRSTPKHS